jgi:hypothetical protein
VAEISKAHVVSSFLRVKPTRIKSEHLHNNKNTQFEFSCSSGSISLLAPSLGSLQRIPSPIRAKWVNAVLTAKARLPVLKRRATKHGTPTFKNCADNIF